MKYLALLLILIFNQPVLACYSSMDCNPGSKCLKRPNQYQGICIGGYSPGNNSDVNPYQDLSQPKRGSTCHSDFDCAYGKSCVKSGHAIQGVCL